MFYTRFKLNDNEFGWIKIFRLFHKDIEPKEIKLNDQLASKLWRSTLDLNNLTKVLIHIETLSTVGVYIWAYLNLPDYFKYSTIGYVILAVEFILIFNVFKTFESFYFLFRIVCKYLSLRTDYVLKRLNNYVHTFERKLNDRYINEEVGKTNTAAFYSDLNQEFDSYQVFRLLQEHDDICSLVKKYNFFWRFYLFAIFFTMPMVIGYFIFLLTFENMYYIHRISLGCIILILISYFYLVSVPAVYLSGKVSSNFYFYDLKTKF